MDTNFGKVLVKYKNGNVDVTLYEDGTKVRTYEGKAYPEHPETIDVKITNECDLLCEYCHEESSLDGDDGDLNALIEKLSELPKGIELAVGGGNPLSHRCLPQFLAIAKSKGWIVNITVNSMHVESYIETIMHYIRHNLIKAIGISVGDGTILRYSDFVLTVNALKAMSSHIVFHVIVGVAKIEIIEEINSIYKDAKILVLGYKQFGRGKEAYTPEIAKELKRWEMYLPKYTGVYSLTFDNLAIDQLDLKRLFTDEEWSELYMGDDGTFSMYVDAVKQEFARTSRSPYRTSFNACSLKDYFQNLQSGAE